MSTTAPLPIFGTTVTAWDPADTSVVQDAGAGGTRYDNSWATSALNCPNVASIASSPTFTAAATFWFHYELYMTSFNGPSSVLLWTMYNASTAVADCHVSGTVGTFQLTFRTLQSGSLTSVGTVNVSGSGALNRMDFGMVSNSGAGTVTVASAGTVVLAVTGLSHSGFTGVTQVKLAGGNSPFENSWWSQTILDASSTIGRNVKTIKQNTLSAVNTTWVATVAELAKVVNTDTTFASSPTAAQNFSLFQSSLSLTGLTILAIGVGLRIQREDASGPQNAKQLIRSGGTNYNSGTISSVTIGYQAAFNAWTTDPHTSAAWTVAAAQAAETGGTSVT